MIGTSLNQPRIGILCILLGMFGITLNDVMIKFLSGDYPLHQMVFARSALGIVFSFAILQMEGGWRMLRTAQPGLHALRCLLIVTANLTYFTALAAMPLADATALFFVAPLMITLLSIPILGERVGPVRMTAVCIGFAGALVMQRPWASEDALTVSRIVLLLPLISALTYALNQVLTRKLGVTSKASAMAIYIQGSFVLVSLSFFLVAGDGRFADGVGNPSLVFLLRPWVWPAPEDQWVFIALGVNSALIGYTLSQAYRLADAGTIAPYEYIGLPLAVFWGYLIFGELPVATVWTGIVLILSAGIFVFLRERHLAARAAGDP